MDHTDSMLLISLQDIDVGGVQGNYHDQIIGNLPY
jgi:hypothetical protein